jgi:hypothetical protein
MSVCARWAEQFDTAFFSPFVTVESVTSMANDFSAGGGGGARARPSNEPISYGKSCSMVVGIRARFEGAAGFRRSPASFFCSME